MEVVYLDQVFAVNLLTDYCIVLASARMTGVILRRGRYALAALFGAVYAALSLLPPLGWLALLPIKAAAGIVMALIAFGGERRFWRCTALFFGTSALFGGAVLALSMAAGMMPGQALHRVTWRVLLPTFAVCYAVVATVFRARLRSAERAILPAELTVNGQSLSLRALRDSGCTLRDPVSGQPAAVISASTLEPQLGALPNDPVAAAEVLRDRADGVRLLPYTAVGIPGGLLAAFRPQSLTVDGRPAALLIALSPTPVSAEGEYELLLPSESIM